MKILIWAGHHDPLDFAIKLFTHGKGSHAAFLRADGQRVHEAFWPRVRDRIYTWEDHKAADVYELEGVSPEQHQMFERLFDSHLRRRIEYSFADLFRYALNRPVRTEHHTFCSRYVLHCCHAILPDSLMPLVRLPFKDWGAPRDLRISPRLLGPLKHHLQLGGA